MESAPAEPDTPDSSSADSRPSGRQVLRDEAAFISNVSQFYNQEELSDVILRVSDQQFFGHKFVLAKSSDVFRTMLYDNRWKDVENTDIELTESVECQAVFDVFLRYLYTAELPITVDTAVGVLCLADKYNVVSLKALCVGYMVTNTASPLVQNALNWYSWAKALNLEELVQSCSRTIAWNLEQLLGTPEWNNMDVQFLSDILHNSDLVVVSEYSVYNALVDWLLLESHVEDLQANAAKLLPLVRFPQMQVKQLYEIERSDFAQRCECREVVSDLIGQAYRFRSLCPSQAALDLLFPEPFYNPRNYMCLAVDTVRMQNALRFGIQVEVRSCVGPVPTEQRDGDWKIIYRRNGNKWNMQLFCHDTATVNGEAYVDVSIVVCNDDGKVVQVKSIPPFTCMRAKHLVAQSVDLETVDTATAMVLLIKPLPH